ncbi:MAG TPA: GGDEF domain-containing protein [Luteimonas sp.]|nr:GGDEF domain-containing protein [Luteimonas sp.]
MPTIPIVPERHALRERNLLAQEAVETRQRVRLGGWFYGIAAVLAFGVAGFEPGDHLLAVAVTGSFVVLAFARMRMPLPPLPDAHESRRYLRRMWALVLATTAAWGAFSAWSAVAQRDPAPLVSLLFSGAFGMALAHTLCTRRLPSALAIAMVMLPSLVMLWQLVGPGVGAMWIVYMVYMLLVMVRSHREYRARLELEEDLRQQRDLFATQSRIDGLTALANHRDFSEALERAVAGADEVQPLSLLIIDIDHFKRINDSFGHMSGDACLVEFARRLRASFVGERECCGRLGGEEFGVILPCAGPDARARAEAFRAGLASSPLEFDGIVEPITVSIGCSSFDPVRHADAGALYRDADAALYRAKVDGRNRVHHVA